MNETEEKMILDLSLDNISKEEFIDNYPVNLIEKPSYFVQVLENALINRNSDDVELALMVAGYIDSIDMYLPVLRKLLLEDWHNQHEIIVDILAGVKDPEDAKCFRHVLNCTYGHDDDIEDFIVPLWIKCIWALGKINTSEAMEYLSAFKNSEYESVKEAVLTQFKKNGWT